MCKAIEDMRREEREEGRKEGINENSKTTALRMLKSGRYPLEEVSNISGLSIDQVKNLWYMNGGEL